MLAAAGGVYHRAKAPGQKVQRNGGGLPNDDLSIGAMGKARGREMSDLLADVKGLAESHGLQFKDCGGGHVQLLGHGSLVNYWPLSKKRTAHRVSDSRRETSVTPWDAVRLCLGAAKAGMRPKAAKYAKKKQRPDFDIRPIKTNPAGLAHFYSGNRPPWEYPTFIAANSDLTRLAALDLRESAAMEDSIEGEK